VHHLPNIVTILRFLLVLPAGLFILRGQYDWAFAVFVLAGISDGIDGALARTFGWTSRFGAVADPIADKLLVAVVYVALASEGLLPIWLAVLVLGRDLLIVAGALAYHCFVAELEMEPTLLGKLNTLANVVFVGLVLAMLAAPAFAWLEPAVATGIWVMAAVTIVSGADYVRIWTMRAWRRGGQS
jgi:cardiolipin synthase